jgi:hypothetical protein
VDISLKAGERVHLAAFWARRFRAVQPKQTFHDANLHHPDNGTALVAAQFYIVVLHCRDDTAGAIDASDPLRPNGHQAGEFVTELAIHGYTLNMLQREVEDLPLP